MEQWEEDTNMPGLRRLLSITVAALACLLWFQTALGIYPVGIDTCGMAVPEGLQESYPPPFLSPVSQMEGYPGPELSCLNPNGYGDTGWPQFFVDPSVVYNWAYGYQRRAAIVWGGEDYLIVWDQKRCINCETDIFLTRVDSDGEILDTSSTPVCTATENQFFPAATYNGSGYFVVWEDIRHGSWDIYGARVTADGEVLDPDGLRLWTTPNQEVRADVAWDGTNYLLVWQGIQPTLPTTSIFAALVSPQGEILDECPLFVSNDTLTANYNPEVAWDGTNYLVVWEDEGG